MYSSILRTHGVSHTDKVQFGMGTASASFGILELDEGDGSRIAAVYNVPCALAATWGQTGVALEGKRYVVTCYGTDADRDGPWSRKLPPLGSGAPLIPLVGASGSIAGRRCILSRSTARLSISWKDLQGSKKDGKTADRQAVATALGKLMRRALEALLREEAAPRR